VFFSNRLPHRIKNLFIKKILLLMFCAAGYLLGFLLCTHFFLPQLSLMCIVSFDDVSIVQMFLSLAMPLFLCYLSVLCSVKFLVYPFIFGEACILFVCACCCSYMLKDAGWLFLLLFLGVHGILFTATLWFSLRCIAISGKDSTVLFCCISFLTCLLCLVKFAFSPYILLFAQ